MDTLNTIAHALARRQTKIEEQDENIGSAKTASSSLSGLIATLIPTLIIFAVFVLLFLVLRRSQRRTYAPRSYVGAVEEWRRSDQEKLLGEGGGGFLGWIKGVWTAK